MLTETLERLERLDGMDSTLFGRQLLSFGRLLLDRGWIAAIGYFSHIDVEVMDDIFEEVEVTVDEAAGRYTYPHPFRRKVILSGSLHEVTRYRFQREPFFDHLATLLGIEPRFASRRRCLVEHHLWYLGDLRVGNRHAFAPMFFGRRLKDAPVEQITSALSDPAFGTGGVVLALKDPKLALPNGHQVRAVADLLVVEDGVEQFDLPVLERILVGLPADPADEPEEWFDAKTGGLRLLHLQETVYFSGIQSQIRLDIDPANEPDIVGSMLDMAAVADASVDAIYSAHNIEHVYAHEVPQVLKEFLRVLKPDGFLVVTCPDLQTVCQLVAEDKLGDAAYTSQAGPITPLDILYGHGAALAAGHLYMAHKTGFTLKILMHALSAAGFASIAGKRRLRELDIWVVASRGAIEEAALKELAEKVLPG